MADTKYGNMVRKLEFRQGRGGANAKELVFVSGEELGGFELNFIVGVYDQTGDWAPGERLVLDFAAKLTRNAYKVTEKDALAFREARLGDEGYVEVLNTAAIQTSLDRLANALGVAPDETPLLP